MNRFLARHASKITGAISGFDRIVIRGTFRQLAHLDSLKAFLWTRQILLKNFVSYARGLSERIKLASLSLAEAKSRPVRYLSSSQVSKEEVARRILVEDPVRCGLICVLTSVEPCMSYEIYRNRATKRLELQARRRKCLFHYHYFVHPEYGFGHARIQTWFPYSVQVCLNGREWLARQMMRAKLRAVRDENCFTWIADATKAQALADEQLRTDWPGALNEIVVRYLNPIHETLFEDAPQSYYWSTYQCEWATDLLFKDAASLAAIYPTLILHAITTFKSRDVLRFLGKRVQPSRYSGEILSDFKDRPEGVRIKHSAGHNSVKAYDKKGSVLRVETTINDPHDLKAYRPKEGAPQGPLAWLPLRKGVADLHRLAELSQASNSRYLEALSSVDCSTPLGELLQSVTRAIEVDGQRYRALKPWDPDEMALLEALPAGENYIKGFRNRDLLERLYPSTSAPHELKRRSARITRLLRLLRAHSIIKRVPGSHRYLLTSRGGELITALLAARRATVSSLLKRAS